MTFTLYSDGKEIGKYTEMSSVDNKLTSISMQTTGYHRHNSQFSKNYEKDKKASYIILTKVFNTKDEIIKDMSHSLIVDK